MGTQTDGATLPYLVIEFHISPDYSHLRSLSARRARLPYLKLDHLIRRHAVPIPHLLCRLLPGHRHAILVPRTTRTSSPTIGERIGERQVFGQEAQLPQDCPLVPGNVFVVEPVSADVDDRCKGDLGLDVGGRDTGQAASTSATALTRCRQGA